MVVYVCYLFLSRSCIEEGTKTQMPIICHLLYDEDIMKSNAGVCK